MTYLTPDDWYANHNLAPGDARLPQKPMQPVASFSASKGLAPTPPMRGYFGSRPTFYQTPTTLTTRSPFAVSDVMWGVNGLGALIDTNAPQVDQGSAFDQASGILDAANAKIKKEMQLAAATSSAIAIGLSFIPVVGWAVGPLYGIVTGISGAHYKKEASQVLADLNNELNQSGAQYQILLQQELDRIFQEVKPLAIQIALSNQALNGLGGGLGATWYRKAIDYAFNPVTHATGLLKVAMAPVRLAAQGVKKIAPASVDKVIDRLDKNTYGAAIKDLDKAQQGMEIISGENILDRARKAADDARVAFRQTMDKLFTEQVAKANSPEYKASLTLTIAKYIRENPIAGQLLTGQVNASNATQQDMQVAQSIADSVNSPGLTALPGIVAAGAVLLMLGLKH